MDVILTMDNLKMLGLAFQQLYEKKLYTTVKMTINPGELILNPVVEPLKFALSAPAINTPR